MGFEGKTVLVTGGCSGVGKIMARKALERKAKKLIVLDINEKAFPELQREWEQYRGRIFCFKVDLGVVSQIENVAQEVKEQHGFVDVLINNAGIVTGKYFHRQTHSEIDRAIRINTQGMMHLTLEFLPDMMEKNTGSIANICSLAGLIANPKMSVYVASKWAAVGWSDSLRLEMNQLQRKIKVTTIMPYYIDTGMFEGVKSKLLPVLKPEPTAEKFIRAIEKEKKQCAVPVPYWFIRLSQGLLPLFAFDWVMQKIFGVYDTMSEFKGRQTEEKA